MGKQETGTEVEAVGAAEAHPAGGIGTSLFARLKVALILGGIIVAECGVAVYLLSRMDVPALAEATIEVDTAPEFQVEAISGEEEIPTDQVEVDLGEYSVTAFRPETNSTLRIDFRLYGAVGGRQEREFYEALEGNLHRVRERILVTVRSADVGDLTDANLGLIRRRILEKTNHALGKPYLRAVIFSDFSFIEQ